MADKTKIEWADATLNYVNGCSLESPGCTNCYAMKQAHRFPVRQGLTVKTKGGMVWTGEVRENPRALEQALAWKRGRAIFWNAHGDLFHPSVPIEWIARQFNAMAETPQHRHMVLTKRSARMRKILNGPKDHRLWHHKLWHRSVLPNVWLGVSAEDQPRWDERTDDLRKTPAAVRFVSAEPLLGLIRDDFGMDGLDWVIAGGESGPGARPMHPDWARSLRDQCAAAGVAFHFKQFGEWAPAEAFGAGSWGPVTDRRGNVRDWMRQYVVCEDRADRLDAHSFTEHATDLVFRVGKKRAGRLLDGAEHNGVPAHG